MIALAVSLAEARERARRCRLLVLDGIDPIEQRNAERTQHRIQTARGATFGNAPSVIFLRMRRRGKVRNTATNGNRLL